MKDIVLTKNGVQVTIATTKIEKVRSKKLSKITQPKSSAQWSGGSNATKIVDLLRIEKRYNIDGYIESDYGTGDTNSDAVDKKTNIESMDDTGGVFTLNENDENFSGAFEKLTISNVTRDEATTTQFFIKFTFLIGENI